MRRVVVLAVLMVSRISVVEAQIAPSCTQSSDCTHKASDDLTPGDCAVPFCAAGKCFWDRDADRDGHGRTGTCTINSPSTSYAFDNTGSPLYLHDDCDDNDPDRYPGNWDGPDGTDSNGVARPYKCDKKDQDCDGIPDNMPLTNASGTHFCTCTVNDVNFCNQDPAGNFINIPTVIPQTDMGIGNTCHYGQRRCQADGTWTSCIGAQGRKEHDTCEPGDDSDCDGYPNKSSPCTFGATIQCNGEGSQDLGNYCGGGSYICNPATCVSPPDPSQCVGATLRSCPFPNGGCQYTESVVYSPIDLYSDFARAWIQSNNQADYPLWDPAFGNTFGATIAFNFVPHASPDCNLPANMALVYAKCNDGLMHDLTIGDFKNGYLTPPMGEFGLPWQASSCSFYARRSLLSLAQLIPLGSCKLLLDSVTLTSSTVAPVCPAPPPSPTPPCGNCEMGHSAAGTRLPLATMVLLFLALAVRERRRRRAKP
jgi:hypothetical protein